MHDTPADATVLAEALAVTADAAPSPAEAHGPTPALAYARPDWATHQGELDCPLCEYSLIGLEEPRCPECGYRFAWADLLDPTRRRHPYLYEHHPRHGFRSFWKTAWHALRPRRFWANLHPSQPSRPGRLLRYWLWVAVHSLIPVALLFWYTGVLVGNYRSTRFFGNGFVTVGPGPATSWLDQTARWLGNFRAPDLRPYRFLVGLVLLWPWATFLTLLIFQASMRRAKVRPVHVLRTVMYSSDLTLWLGAVLLGWGVVWFGVLRASTNYSGDDWPKPVGFIGVVLLAILFGYRLAVAYRRYLQFDHAVATAVATQFIVALAAFTAFINLVVLW